MQYQATAQKLLLTVALAAPAMAVAGRAASVSPDVNRIATYPTVPTSLASPIGSGDATKPGFRFRVYQVPIGANNSILPNQIEIAEQQLAGLWGTNGVLGAQTNIANLAGFDPSGFASIPGVINLSADPGSEPGLGNFKAPDHPDQPIPGIPGLTGSADRFAIEILTYLEFPSAGNYSMGVSSDGCFRVTPSEINEFLGTTIYVKNVPGLRIPGVPTLSTDGGYGTPFPKSAITAKVVYVNPNDACNTPINCADIKGNIALIDRGTCSFSPKSAVAQLCGAVAVIIVNNVPDRPFTMGAGTEGSQVTIPNMMIGQADGATLKAHLSDPGGLIVIIGDDPTFRLGQFNSFAGRDPGETQFSFAIPQPGVYPMRLVFQETIGNPNLEWFTVSNTGERTLLNDSTKPNSLKAYRARAASPALSFNASGGQITLSWTPPAGTLEQAPAVTGPWGSLGTANPQTVSNPGTGAQFFRVRVP